MASIKSCKKKKIVVFAKKKLSANFLLKINIKKKSV